MGRESVIQASFNAGELSPLMLARTDLKKRESGMFTCLNGIPLVQGGWTRRPGSLFLKEVKFSERETRLFPFRYSVQQTYILEFGHEYIRFFTQHGILTQASQAITAATQANPVVVTYGGADTYANGDRVYITTVTGMTQLNNREFIVAGLDAPNNTFQLQEWVNGAAVNVNGTGYDAYVSDGSVSEIFQVTTAFTEAQLPDVRIVQSADTLYILHPSVAPQKLVRNSALSWTLSTMVFADGPYDTENQTTTTLAPSATTGAITITASSVVGINNDTGFQTTDVGRLVRIKNGATWGYAVITAWTSTTLVNATVLSAFAAVSANVAWRLGVWSDTTGFPRCGAFFEDRLWLAGASLFPQRVDGSRTGRYQNFSPTANDGTVAADNAVAVTLNSSDVNAIRWLVDSEKALLAGTAGGEWQIKPSSLGESVTPTNISGKPSTKHGSEFIAPVVAGKATLFVQRAGKKLRELAYVFEADGFKAPDMTLLAEHIMRPGTLEIVYQEQPQAIVWGRRSDGVLLGFTYERDQDVVGWHRHELGGRSDIAGIEGAMDTGEVWTINQSGSPHAEIVDMSGKKHLSLPGTPDNYASTEDSVALSIVGDIHLRIKLALNEWPLPNSAAPLIYKWHDGVEPFSGMAYSLWAYGPSAPPPSDNTIAYAWSSDGTGAGKTEVVSSVVFPFTPGAPIWLDVFHDVDNGAGGNDVTFRWSTDYDPATETGTWTQIGDTITTAGVTSLFDSPNPVVIAQNFLAPTQQLAGKVYYAEIRNGIDGPIVAVFDPNQFSLVEPIPVVESLAVVPSPDTTRDELYMVVQRHVNGNFRRYVELFAKMWETEDFQEDAFHLDCGWTEVSVSPDNTVTGLWHLEGETVSVIADGSRHPDVVVMNGKITLNYSASIISLGYSFQSDAVLLPVDAGAQEGSAQGKTKRIVRVGFWLLDTLGISYGPSFDKLTEIVFRQWGDVMGEATPLFTGVFRGRFEGDYDKLGQVHWRCEGPFPATVLAAMPQVNTSDDT